VDYPRGLCHNNNDGKHPPCLAPARLTPQMEIQMPDMKVYDRIRTDLVTTLKQLVDLARAAS
jgi:hypothetical protein